MSMMSTQKRPEQSTEQGQSTMTGSQEQGAEAGMGNAGRAEELGIESTEEQAAPETRLDDLLKSEDADPCDVADAFAMLAPERRLSVYAERQGEIEAAVKTDGIAQVIVQSALESAAAAKDARVEAMGDEGVRATVDAIFDQILSDVDERIRAVVKDVAEQAEAGQDPDLQTIEEFTDTLHGQAEAGIGLRQALGGSAMDDGLVAVMSQPWSLTIDHHKVEAEGLSTTMELEIRGRVPFRVQALNEAEETAAFETAVQGPQGETVSVLPFGVLHGLAPLDWTMAG